jgi:hypothetical protein
MLDVKQYSWTSSETRHYRRLGIKPTRRQHWRIFRALLQAWDATALTGLSDYNSSATLYRVDLKCTESV